MRHICTFCAAKHFLCEMTYGTMAQPMFRNCCYKGKVQLPPVRRYPPFWIPSTRHMARPYKWLDFICPGSLSPKVSCMWPKPGSGLEMPCEWLSSVARSEAEKSSKECMWRMLFNESCSLRVGCFAIAGFAHLCCVSVARMLERHNQKICWQDVLIS